MSTLPESKLPTLQQWDRLALYLSIAIIVALAWWYLIDMAGDMSAPDPANAKTVQAMEMSSNANPQSWTLQTFWMMFVMWAVMMMGMMLPSAMRTILIYARVSQHSGSAVVPVTLCFVAGYLFVWTFFSLIATAAQWWLNQQALLSPMMVSTSAILAACLLIMTGLYQLTPLKENCLKHCQSPVSFICQHFKRGCWGGFSMGLQHGVYCLGCCALLMSLLFIAGVMNLLWILAIALYVLIEKLLPANVHLTSLSGTLMVLIGIFLILFNG